MTFVDRFIKGLLALALFLLSQVPMLILYVVWQMGISLPPLVTILIALVQLGILAGFVWFGKWQSSWTWDRSVWTKKNLLLVLVAVLALFGVSILGSWLVNLDGARTSVNQAQAESLVRDLPKLLPLIAIVFHAPLVEELIFRGLLLEAFNGRWIGLGYAFSTILFALCHTPTNLGSWVTYLGMGAILAFVRYKSNRLEVSVLTHAVNNSLGFLLILLG